MRVLLVCAVTQTLLLPPSFAKVTTLLKQYMTFTPKGQNFHPKETTPKDNLTHLMGRRALSLDI